MTPPLPTGIGLITCLAGATEIDLVVAGEYNILEMGPITPAVVITFFGVIVVCVATEFHIKGSFCLAIIVCSILWWVWNDDFPGVFAVPRLVGGHYSLKDDHNARSLAELSLELLILYVIYLDGLVSSLSRAASRIRDDGSVPRGGMLYVVTGLFCVLSGMLGSAPILISPESSVAIKAGAKTGLSAVVCGLLFLLTIFFGPILGGIPAAGSSPVLIMIGVILFQNSARLDWKHVHDAAPAFIVLFFIPFTYSILTGVTCGYIVYLFTNLFSGDLLYYTSDLFIEYFPSTKTLFDRLAESLPTFYRNRYQGFDKNKPGDCGGLSPGVRISESSSIATRKPLNFARHASFKLSSTTVKATNENNDETDTPSKTVEEWTSPSSRSRTSMSREDDLQKFSSYGNDLDDVSNNEDDDDIELIGFDASVGARKGGRRKLRTGGGIGRKFEGGAEAAAAARLVTNKSKSLMEQMNIFEVGHGPYEGDEACKGSSDSYSTSSNSKGAASTSPAKIRQNTIYSESDGKEIHRAEEGAGLESGRDRALSQNASHMGGVGDSGQEGDQTICTPGSKPSPRQKHARNRQQGMCFETLQTVGTD